MFTVVSPLLSRTLYVYWCHPFVTLGYSSPSTVRRGRRGQVGCCGVSVSGIRGQTRIGAKGTLAAPMMRSVCDGRVVNSSISFLLVHYLPVCGH